MAPWMRHNRRRDSGVMRLGTMVKLIVFFALVALAAGMCVQRHRQNAQLAADIEQCRVQLQKLQDTNQKLNLQISELESPSALIPKNAEMGLGLQQPSEKQIHRVNSLAGGTRLDLATTRRGRATMP
jgi:cell division protein FtsB